MAISDSAPRRSNAPQILFSVTLLIAFLRPYPQAALNTQFVSRMSDLILFLFATILVFYVVYTHRFHLNMDTNSVTVLILITSLVMLSAISIFASPVLTTSDLLEVPRLLMYSVLFLTGYLIDWKRSDITKYIILPIFFFTTIEIILAFGQYVRFEPLMIILRWYSSTRLLSTTRVVGTFGNPYMFAIYLILPLSYCTHYLLISSNRILRLISIVLSLLTTLMILFTQSRSVLIVLFGTSIYMGIALLLTSRDRFIRYLIFGMFITLVSSILLLLFIDLTYLSRGVQTILRRGITNVPAAKSRFETYQFAISLFLQRPWIGWGPAKTVIPYIENNYILYLFRYGVFGLILFVTLLFHFFTVSFRRYNHMAQDNSNIIPSFYFSIHIWIVSLIAGSLTNDFIANPRIYPILFLLFGVIYRVKSTQFPLSE